MESDLAKTLLQGGWMTTAVKHKQPRCFFNSCPFYITTNKIPDFGAEQQHVLRRLAIYQTQSLQEITVGADKWIFDNAMACVSWMATEISANLEYIEDYERWYEHEETAAISCTRSRESLVHIPRVTYADINERHTDPWMEINLAVQEIHPSFEKEVERATRQCSTRRAVPPMSPSTRDQLQLNSQVSADDTTFESYSDNGTPNSNEVDPQVTSK